VGISITNFIDMMSVTLKQKLTDEQRNFVSDFTSPLISFSFPGTGKTTSATVGLLVTELYHRIPGKNIYALSFTNLATLELKNRYEDSCKLLRVHSTINFSTLHKLCGKILKDNFKLLGLNTLKIGGDYDIESTANMLLEASLEMGINIDKHNVKNVVDAVRSLNSSLIFDKAHVESKYDFKKARLSYVDFTRIRSLLYTHSKLVETIALSDILLYTLELMLRYPEVSAQMKEKCKVLVVDEFQDLSLLQLRVISLISDNVIAIGDIKQQIYAFNGACQEIVEQYYKYFPTARQINLTQSFRCKNEIVAYAKEIIKPNEMNEQEFKGTGPGGDMKLLLNIDIKKICDNIEEEFHKNQRVFKKSILFLFRNNFTIIPVVEELFVRRLPFRVNKYMQANLIPLIKELCALCEFAVNPSTLSNILNLRYLIPEFRVYGNLNNHPLYKICSKTGKSPFEVNYQFRDVKVGSTAMSLLVEARDLILKNSKLSEIFNLLWPTFKQVYVEGREHFLDYSADYYIKLVRQLTQEKSYIKFIKDEALKMEVIRESEMVRRGVRCYTFHAAKGLEADEVYIIGADEGVVPNSKKLDAMEEKGCAIEKAREIRNERSLAFVACTRAREKLYISSTAGLSSIFTGLNVYESYDKLYKQHKIIYSDVESFESFFKGEVVNV
jgi:DNA helicase-2/ATP-dependent DNA helicase PcrA